MTSPGEYCRATEPDFTERRRRKRTTLIRTNMLANAAAFSIGAYQRYLSPFKGFACARRVHMGGCSCSEFAKRAVLKFGLLGGLALLPGRFRACRRSWQVLQQQEESGGGFSPPVFNEPCPLWANPQYRNQAGAALALFCPCWPGWPKSW